VWRVPVLNSWDTWVLGNHDTCTNPVTPQPPVESEGNEQNRIDFSPAQNTPRPSWPPQIPTHPPDHTAATHPPSLFGIRPVTTSKPSITTQRTTTWATRPPFGQVPAFAPIQTTTKKPSFIVTTEAPIINDVNFDSGSCGAKNGFQVKVTRLE
jgi:hypothetical protein